MSVFATDQCSYGNRTADRKSTTISGKWFKDYFRLSGAGSGSATTCLFPSILLYEQRYRICFWIARDNRAAQNFKLNGKCIRIRMKWSLRFCAAFFILRQVFGDFSSLTREIGRSWKHLKTRGNTFYLIKDLIYIYLRTKVSFVRIYFYEWRNKNTSLLFKTYYIYVNKCYLHTHVRTRTYTCMHAREKQS